MNSSTIEKILKSDRRTKNVFGGVYASDKLSEKVDRYPKAFVANVDTSDKPGSHWISFWFESPEQSEFWDPLGQKPNTYTSSFVSFLARNSSQWTYNPRTVQSAFSNVCGHFCIYYIFYRCRNVSMSTIMYKFTNNLEQNDRLVASFVRKTFHVNIPNNYQVKDLCQSTQHTFNCN